MGRVLLDEYLRLIDAAFATPLTADRLSHSVLGNLGSVPEAALDWVPPGGMRTVRDIAEHVGGAVLTYVDYAFGERRFTPENGLPTPPQGDAATLREIEDWMKAAHSGLAAAILAVPDDTALDGWFTSIWGDRRTIRDLLSMMIQHYVYHAGEINHLRGLYEQRDAWAWELDR
ncbi:MAG: DinB family protein [Dehalococcoidia bacterium]